MLNKTKGFIALQNTGSVGINRLIIDKLI